MGNFATAMSPFHGQCMKKWDNLGPLIGEGAQVQKLLISLVSVEGCLGDRSSLAVDGFEMSECSGKRTCTILVVDDDDAMRQMLSEALTEEGCQVVEAQNGKEALDLMKKVSPSLIVTDLHMPHGGYPYLRLLQEQASSSPIVVMTAYGDRQSKAKALECGAQAYFEKPLPINHLKTLISQMCFLNPCGNLPPG